MHSLKRLAGYLGPYWKPFLATGSLLVLQTGFGLLPPLFQRQIVDKVIGAGDLSRLGLLVAAMSGVYALGGVAGYGAPGYISDNSSPGRSKGAFASADDLG